MAQRAHSPRDLCALQEQRRALTTAVALLPSEVAALEGQAAALAAQQAALAAQQAELAARLAEVCDRLQRARSELAVLPQELARARAGVAAGSALFARISASRAPAHAIGAFAGGTRDHTILSACAGALLPYFSTRAILPLRAACRDAAQAVARHAWGDTDTPIEGSLRAWAACFPAATAANAGAGRRVRGAPQSAEAAEEEWACLRALRGPAGAPSLRELWVLGASAEVAAGARAALPGVRIIATLRCEPRQRFNDASGAYSLAALGSGLLASCSVDGRGARRTSVELWNADEGRCVGSMEGTGECFSVTALPRERLAIVRHSPASVAVWDAATRERVCELQGHSRDPGLCVAALPGGLVATGSSGSALHLCNSATGAHVATLSKGIQAVSALAVLRDGSLAAGYESCVRLWDLPSRTCTAELRGHSDYLHALAALDVGGVHLAGSGSNGVVYLWSAGSSQVSGRLTHPTLRNDVYALAALPRGLLASGGDVGELRLWSVSARACLAVLSEHDLRPVRGLAALPDGRLASGCEFDMICVWELRGEALE
jgi:hypothetical protein